MAKIESFGNQDLSNTSWETASGQCKRAIARAARRKTQSQATPRIENDRK